MHSLQGYFTKKTMNNKNISHWTCKSCEVRSPMAVLWKNGILLWALAAGLAMLIFLPGAAAGGTISVAYRGSGGSYIGDTIIFDGINTIGNTTLLKITGPGLPEEGLPPYNLNGAPGSGNTAEVNPDGTWKFVWYTSSIEGIEKMQTGRYFLKASSLYGNGETTSTSVLMKKPEFYIAATPNPVTAGNYVQLTGVAEHSSDSAKIQVANSSGTVLHAFTSPVSSSGYLSYGFHVDMPPGKYTITVTDPAWSSPYVTSLSVIQSPEATTTNAIVDQSVVQTTNETLPKVPSTTSIPLKPTRTPLSELLVIGSILIAGIVMLSGREKS